MTNSTAADRLLTIQRMKALSDEKRLRIREQLAGGERCVCDLTDALEPASPCCPFI
ncbi:MAG: ArsR family transcriptional regulator [Gemmatimonadota bacterium]